MNTEHPLNRTLFIADNLDLLRSLDNASIDLICTDPPFAKNRTFKGAIRPKLTPDELAKERATMASWLIESRSQAVKNNIEWPDDDQGASAKFSDIWRWENVIHEDWIQKMETDFEPLARVIETARQTHSESMGAYLAYMAIRLIEMHRVLKATGSLYLHCDPTASHYLKLALDAIFGESNFRNEIAWHYKTGGAGRKRFSMKHDIILFYAKTKEYKYYQQLEKSYTKSKSRKPGIVNYGGGLTEFFEDEHGVYNWINMHDVWDIPYIGSTDPERTGYPTQKPVALAERIINASSLPGETVLDPFAGCAYVPVAAERNGRNWVACDISVRALTVLRRQFGKFHYAVDGKQETAQQSLIIEADISTRGPGNLPERSDKDPIRVPSMKSPPPRKFKVPASIIPESEMTKILLQWSGWMAWCCGFANRMPDGKIIESTNNFHLDHIDPKSKEGSNQITNRAPLCPSHNLRKKDRRLHLEELRDEIIMAGELQVKSRDDLVNLAEARERALVVYAEAYKERPSQMSLGAMDLS